MTQLYAVYDGFRSAAPEDVLLIAVHVDRESALAQAREYSDSEDYPSIQVVEFTAGTSPESASADAVIFEWVYEEV